MRALILGGDGYLGWPTAMSFASKGWDVVIADNYFRRMLCLQTASEPLLPSPDLFKRIKTFKEKTGLHITAHIGDLTDMQFMNSLFQGGGYDTVIHYAEQPSAPYSMIGEKEARLTLHNNIGVTMNCIWAVLTHCPDCHIVKLGTMGEYGTPNIDIEEGYIAIAHKGRQDIFLYPRQAGSLYHTSKILDTDLLWFYVRLYGLRVTDLMQGPVYGLMTDEIGAVDAPALTPHFNYDDIFGTVLNRFLVQAVAGIPLTVYGKGGQTRGYLNIRDTLACVRLAAENPPAAGKLRILNQFTQTFSVAQLAEKVIAAAKSIGLNASIQHIANPRKEQEEHYYNPAHSGLLELGLKPYFLTNDLLVELLELIVQYKSYIEPEMILPRVNWH
ncbi:NAD-dependent epimerase/dehydratase family protein [Desulfovibrio sp. OttesenSCG-928-M16]|nr:NAD-dependent epimerase/dehydratase family protein [Desulfovibrio sp. OttesenSCG-928-M16]